MAFDPSTAVAAAPGDEDELNPRLTVPGAARRGGVPTAAPLAFAAAPAPDVNAGPAGAPPASETVKNVPTPPRPATGGFDPSTAIPEGSGPDNRTLLNAVSPIDPDKAARAEALAKKYNLPFTAVLGALPEVEQKAKTDAAREQLIMSPAVADHLRRNTAVAAQAHDDLGPLGAVAQAVSDMGGAVKSGFFRASRAAAGTFRAATELVAPMLDVLEPTEPGQVRNPLLPYLGAPGGNPLRRLAEGFDIQAQAAGATAKAAAPKAESDIGKGFYSGVESLTQNVLALPMLLLNPAAGLTMMTQSAGGEAYQTAREQGLSMPQALPYATSQAAIEFATERMPALDLVKNLKGGVPFFKTLMANIVKEVPGEQVATLLQDLNEWAVLPENRAKTIGDYAAERPSAALQTLVATVVASGGSTAAGHGLQTVGERFTRDAANANTAIKAGQSFEQAMNASAESALRQRNPEAFHAMATELSQGGQVWVDAEVLNQLPPEILARMEGVAQELPDALAANAPVPVKIADVLTHVAGTPSADTFLQHSRATPEAPTVAEADAAGQQATEYLQNEANRVIAEAANGDELRASAERVRSNIAEQITATGRHRPKVAEAMSQWASAFFTTMGARHGMTAEEMYQRYPLRVLAQAGVRQPGAVASPAAMWVGEIANADGVDPRTIRSAGDVQSLAGAVQSENAGQNVLEQADRVRPELLDLVTRALETGNENASVDVMPVTTKLVEEAKGRIGVDLTGYRHTVDMYSVRHAMRRHGDASTEQARGQVAITADDVQAIPDVLTDPDARVYGAKTPRGQEVVASIKRLPDGSLLVVEEVRTGRKTLAMTSMRKYPAARDFDSIARTLLSNARSDGGDVQIVVNSPNVLEQAATPPTVPRGPTETAQDHANSLDALRVSPRIPTAVKATENPLAPTRLQPDLETAKRDAAAFEHNIGLMSGYPNFTGMEGTTDEKAEAMLRQAVDNLLWLHDRWKPGHRDRSKMWYVGGNRIAHRWAERFGVKPEHVAGVIAATSPQKDWFQNVSLAERILEAVINQSDVPWDASMTALVRRRDWGPKEVPDPSVYEGKTLRDLHDGTPQGRRRMAVWIRAWDEANNPQVARVITPEGNFADFDKGKTGKPVALRWQSFPAVEKTIQVLTTSDVAAISDVIGANHKVRSFYNNIIAPYAGDDVTIDTHAVAAALLRPLGSSSLEVAHNFGSGQPGAPGPKNSAITGLNGTYAIFAEAYRRAAKERGILPREMQSITWEAVRGLFRPEQKNEKIKAQADRIWQSVATGEIDADAARKQVEKLVGGIAEPAWAGSDARAHEGAGDSSYARELHPGSRDAGTAVGRGGVAAAGAVQPGQDSDAAGVLEQPTLAEGASRQGPRGTFNPATLDLVLNENANLSTWFHETGHFYLEVMSDLAAQPNAPQQVTKDWQKILDWFGVKDAATWDAMTLDEQRKYHERWAESIEQYVMEGKAPSAEMAGVMRRFAAWMKSVYVSIRQFLAQHGQTPAAGGATLNQAGEYENDLLAPMGESRMVGGETLLKDYGDVKAFESDYKSSTHRSVRYVKYDDAGEPIGVLQFRTKGPRSKRAVIQNVYTAAPARRSGVASGLLRFAQRDFDIKHSDDLTGDGAAFKAADGKFYQAEGGAQDGASMPLNDSIRAVMDRMLATDEQIEQANEIAGMQPDEDADAEAAERLRKRSMADLKYTVRLRDKAIKALQDKVKDLREATRKEVTAEVDAMLPVQAKAALDKARQATPDMKAAAEQHKTDRKAAEKADRERLVAELYAANPDVKGLQKGQLRVKNKRAIDNQVDAAMIEWDKANPKPDKAELTDGEMATIADSFGYETTEAMLQAIDEFGNRNEAIESMTEQRMLEEHGDLIGEDNVTQAANEAVHNEARSRSLASELRTQGEMLGRRQDTGETTAKGARKTVSVLAEAARQFGERIMGRTPIADLKAAAWKHTAAERRASKKHMELTAAGKTQEAVQAKQDQVLNNAAARAAIDGQAEAGKIGEFFKRVLKGSNTAVVEKGRDPDMVNAARAVLMAYGLESPVTKSAASYLETVKKNDPDTWAAIEPMMDEALQNAQPIESMTLDELRGLHEQIQGIWFLAKASRQMEVDGDKMDVDDAAEELHARMTVLGIPATIPGERGALTKKDQAVRGLQFAASLLRRVEQWSEGMGPEFKKYIFQPIKDAADKYRTDRTQFRKKFQALVDEVAPHLKKGTIEAPELGYTFGQGHNGIGHAELLHAVLHTGNESNKRKLLLGRGWATENPDGTLDTRRWDAFIQRMVDEGQLTKEHFDFAQGVWDLMEETKPLAQKTHRDVFGRYFDEVSADSFVDPFGVQRRGGYVPAQADPEIVQDADLRALLEGENQSMSYSFPSTSKGFTKSRVEYNRPLKLDLRTLPQHLDKVLLFSHMEPAVRGVSKLLRKSGVSGPLGRIDPSAIGGMLMPWLNRSARQQVETPIVGDGRISKIASTMRRRAGASLMFANISNTVQQITGFSTAAVKVKPSNLMRAAATYLAHPKKTADSVAEISPYMNNRMRDEVSAMNDALEDILLKPSAYERMQAWSQRNAYFMQSAVDNVMSSIVWTGAYNEAVQDGKDDAEAIKFADGVVRQTQGSTLPEDVSRLETGPAYARLFTQFVGYFNMMANTNATALKQIAQETGLKRGAGKALYVLLMGMLVPLWVAEAIAIAFKGGPDDEDDDGYLDDWIAAVLGMGTVKGMLAQVPFIGQLANAGINRLNDNPADDRVSMSPAVSLLEGAVGAPVSVYKAVMEEGSKRKAVRDAASLVSMLTGLPATAAARPLGYLAGVADDDITPTSGVDAVRGALTGAASPGSK